MEYFTNLFKNVTSEPIGSEVSQSCVSTDITQDTPLPVRNNPEARDIEDKFAGDIAALARHFGHLESGETLEIGLQQILDLCPRSRRRADAYNLLIRTLEERYQLKLIINSKNNKNYGKEKR